MRIGTHISMLLIGAAACGCYETVPMTPIPGGPQVLSTSAGLFAPLPAPPPKLPCVTELSAAHVGPQGVFDNNNDGLEAVTLIAELREEFALAGVFGLVWLPGDAVIGLGLSPVVEVPVGEYRFTLAAAEPFGGFQPLCSLFVSVVPPDTSTAIFGLDELSISNACFDPCTDTVTPLPSDPNGVVMVHLDGSASSGGLDLEITRFSWRDFGVEVANEPMVTLPLNVGEHEIELLVENDVGLIHRRIKNGIFIHDGVTPEPICPERG